MKQKINRIGEQKKNKYGNVMTIVEYNSAKSVIVEFENGYKTEVQYGNFKKGNISNPYDKSIYNVGYVGEGEYKVFENGSRTVEYKYWYSMLNRCYSKLYHEDKPTYEDKYVCEEWYNFQNFAKWFNENYYEVDGDKMCLDKDILFKGNKIYSPDTCVFVPNRINNLFTKRQNDRGEYPIGVYYHKSKFNSQCSIYDEFNKKYKQKHLGTFDTPEEAFHKYKKFKEQYIKEVAEEYKDLIPTKLYEAMCKYVVEIND